MHGTHGELPPQTPAAGKSSGERPDGTGAPVQWPLKLMRISPLAPFFHRADLLVAADCTAFSYESFREAFGAGKTLVIGCPDAYGERFLDKLTEIITLNDIMSVTLVRMDAECCKRMRGTAMAAIRASGKDIPLNIVTLFGEGEIVD